MGVLTKLLGLPLAPIKGVMWVADRVAQAAEEELYGEPAIRRRLGELQGEFETGQIAEEEFLREEGMLLERLAAAREESGADRMGIWAWSPPTEEVDGGDQISRGSGRGGGRPGGRSGAGPGRTR